MFFTFDVLEKMVLRMQGLCRVFFQKACVLMGNCSQLATLKKTITSEGLSAQKRSQTWHWEGIVGGLLQYNENIWFP